MPEMPNPSGFPYPAANQATVATPADSPLGWRYYWRMFRFVRYAAVLILFPFAHYSGCLASQADKDQALQLETAIHDEMVHGDADGMYNNAGKEFQDAVPRARHDAYIAWIRGKFGSPIDCTPINTGVRFGLGSRMLRSQCVTEFSSGDKGLETFIWKQTDDGYRLYHYDIKPQ
jgi:hypothetical protein